MEEMRRVSVSAIGVLCGLFAAAVSAQTPPPPSLGADFIRVSKIDPLPAPVAAISLAWFLRKVRQLGDGGLG